MKQASSLSRWPAGSPHAHNQIRFIRMPDSRPAGPETGPSPGLPGLGPAGAASPRSEELQKLPAPSPAVAGLSEQPAPADSQ